MINFFQKKTKDSRDHKATFFAFLIIIIASIIPILSTYGKLNIGGDTLIPLIPQNLSNLTYEWIDVANGIYTSSDFIFIIGFFLFLHKIGLSLYQSGFFFQFLIFFLSGIGLYFIYNLFNEESRLFGIIPALFFIYSPHRYDHMIYFQTTPIIILILYFFLRALKKKHFGVVDILALGILPAFLANLPNPKYHFLTAMMLVVTLSVTILTKYLNKDDLKRNLTAFILILLLNAHILLRLGYFAYSYTFNPSPLVKTTQSEQASDHALDYGAALSSQMIRLWHTPSMNSEDVAIMKTPLFAISYTFMPLAIFIIFPLLFYRFLKKYRIFYFIFFCNAFLFVFMSKSANPPFGFIYDTMVNSGKVFAFMRTSAGLVVFAAIFYELIFGIVFQYLFMRFKGKLRVLLVTIALFILLVPGYHIWSGKYFRNTVSLNQYADKNQHGKIVPQDYFDSANVIAQIPLDTKIDIYPGAEGYQSNSWGYFGFVIYSWIYDKPIIGFNKYQYDGRANSMTNAMYLVHDKSLLDENQRKNGISNQLEKRIFSSHTIDVYKKNESFFVPHIYTPSTISYANHIPINIFLNGWKSVQAFYHPLVNSAVSQFSPTITNKPLVVYKKINPTKYRVRLLGASGIVPIIFSENYDPHWNLYLSNGINHKSADSEFISKNYYNTIQDNNLTRGHFWETWFLRQIDNSIHVPVNTFENSWIIDIKRLCSDNKHICISNPDGTYDVETIIEFFPQQVAYLGAIITLTTFLYICGKVLYEKK